MEKSKCCGVENIILPNGHGYQCTQCGKDEAFIPAPSVAKLPQKEEWEEEFMARTHGQVYPRLPITDWEEALQVEVMEDYLRDARFGERLLTNYDIKEHLAVMRKHFENLKSFIRHQKELSTKEERAKCISIVKSWKNEDQEKPTETDLVLENILKALTNL